MPTAADIAALNAQVLWLVLGLSMVFGIASQHSHFCTMGAISDIVNMGETTRLRMWAIASAVAMLGFSALVSMGYVQADKTLYASSKVLWLSAMVGGFLFGVGMVLASGCGNKTLLRLGAGSLKSLVVFVVMGLFAFITLKGLTAVVRVATVDAVFFELAQPDVSLRFMLSGVLGTALLAWALRSAKVRRWSVFLPSVVIGAIVVAIWYVSGSIGYVSEHPDTLQEAFIATHSGKAESLSFVAPMAHVLDWLMFFSDKSKVLTLGVVALVGVTAGGCIDALCTRTFRWEGFASVEDLANHLIGAALMGIGGVMAMGCTIGQGITGLSTLSPMSFIAVACIIAGAWAGLKYQAWRA